MGSKEYLWSMEMLKERAAMIGQAFDLQFVSKIKIRLVCSKKALILDLMPSIRLPE